MSLPKKRKADRERLALLGPVAIEAGIKKYTYCLTADRSVKVREFMGGLGWKFWSLKAATDEYKASKFPEGGQPTASVPAQESPPPTKSPTEPKCDQSEKPPEAERPVAPAPDSPPLPPPTIPAKRKRDQSKKGPRDMNPGDYLPGYAP